MLESPPERCYFLTNLIDLALDPAAWAALATLIAMEIVLGVDNLIFVALLTSRCPRSRGGAW